MYELNVIKNKNFNLDVVFNFIFVYKNNYYDFKY